MDERFLRAWFPRRHRVLGRQMRPFSLAHRLALETLGSPLLTDDAPFTIADLCVAVRVCAMVDPMRPVPRPGWHDRLQFWRCTFQAGYFEKQSRAFLDFLGDCCAVPQFWETSDPVPARSSVAWVLEVAAALLRHTSLNEREVWSLPVGRACWYYTVLSRQTGADLDVLSTDDEAFLDSLREDA
jgi:hypothetical protein